MATFVVVASIAILLVLFDVALFVSGIVLIRRGDRVKYRRDHCTCGYIINHLAPKSHSCPECGARLSKNRARLWARGDKVVYLGIALVLLSISGPPILFFLLFVDPFIFLLVG